MPFYDRAGAKIYFETYGKGPPILLLAPGGMKSAIRFGRTRLGTRLHCSRRTIMLWLWTSATPDKVMVR